MSQREKARAMLSKAGHGAELKHVSVRSGSPSGVAAGAPNQAADNTPGGGAMPGIPAAGPSLPRDPDMDMDA